MAADVEQWGLWETSLTGPTNGNPYLDVQFSCTFRHLGTVVTVPGFYDGDGVYRVRFSPSKPGTWKYATKSNRAELNGKSGAFEAAKPKGNNHGPVEVYKTYYLRYADGTPYHQFGTTCYAWVHQPEVLQQQTLETLSNAPFNKIRFCVFPKWYIHNRVEPELFAFRKRADGKFDFSQPDPAFWRHFEQRILDLQKLGLEADLILWHPYDHWGFAQMSREEDDRYLRYCIARFSAYRNVWWSLANEYDLMKSKKMEDWDRFFSILQKEDPHQRLRGIHNCRGFYDHSKSWVTHSSVQSSAMTNGLKWREQYGKPVIFDECRYEGNISSGWGKLSGRQMTQRFWLGTFSGCYIGHGETYQDTNDILWWSKGGVLKGESPRRIQWLKDTFMVKAPPFEELKPLGSFVLAKKGEYYAAYCLDQKERTIELAGKRPYKVELIDPWEMTVTEVGTAAPGRYTFSAPKAD
jgi:hypothetical protein